MSRIYIDTNFLIDAVAGRRQDIPYQKRQLYRIGRMPMDVNIPQIIIGEAFAIITRKSSTDDLKGKIFDLVELIKTLVSDTGSCIPPVNQNTINMAKEIKADDSFVDWTDAVFISHAIVDLDARIVFTTDTNIQNSRVIYDKIKDRKEDFGTTLRIMDSVP